MVALARRGEISSISDLSDALAGLNLLPERAGKTL
jgi:hypothetical protein